MPQFSRRAAIRAGSAALVGLTTSGFASAAGQSTGDAERRAVASRPDAVEGGAAVQSDDERARLRIVHLSPDTRRRSTSTSTGG